jgi:hypothetical protein
MKIKISQICVQHVMHGTEYSMRYTIQHYVIKFVSDLRQVGGFLLELRFPPPIKLTVWNIVESGVKHHKPTNQSMRYMSHTSVFNIHVFVNMSFNFNFNGSKKM